MKNLMISIISTILMVGCSKFETTNNVLPLNPTGAPIQSPIVADQGLDCTVFDLSSLNPNSVPDFDTIPNLAIGSLILPDIDAPYSSVQYPFQQFSPEIQSKIKGAWGMSCLTSFEANVEGNYIFATLSDDGALVYIDGDEVVNDNGIHGFQEAQGTVSLTVGIHAMRIDAIQNNQGNQGLQLLYQTPNTLSFDIIPPSVLSVR